MTLFCCILMQMFHNGKKLTAGIVFMLQKEWDEVWINASLVTCEETNHLINPGALAVKGPHIAWVGAMEDLPGAPEALAHVVHDAQGQCITPGFIDCHTHLIYAGNRAHEFEMRLKGATYEEIARGGGGIQSTVTATRAASEDDLLKQSLVRARALMNSGVTTLEIKSGYGLDWETEQKILRVAKRMEELLPLTIQKTFLGAHTFPLEYRDHPDEYVTLICDQMIPAVAAEKLAEAVDVFCENIAFNIEQTERIFKAAQKHGLAIKCHSEQLSNSGSAKLAAKYQALSVDHLEHATEDCVKVLAQSNTVAVLLPGAYYYLRETNMPPIAELKKHKVPIAIASDCNPGTSPIMSILLILNMACTLFRLTPEDAVRGVTIQAAKALGMDKTHGSLSKGKVADFAIWHVKDSAELSYYMGANPLAHLIKSGQLVK